MKIRNQQDFASGLLCMGVGIVFAVRSTHYAIGTADSMGPGYFPLLLAIVLTLLGAAILCSAVVVKGAPSGKIGSVAWRPLAFVIAANVVFGVAMGGLPFIGLPPLGLIVGVYLLTTLAAMSVDRFRFVEVLVLATVLAVICYVIFILALKQQIAVWPTFG